MNLDDLEDLLSDIIPSGFEFDYDRKGRLIIRTTLIKDDDGELTDNEDDESESVFDDETEPLEEDEEDEDD